MNKDFGYWFAGLVDGEGSFLISNTGKHQFPVPKFSLTLRDDDLSLLEHIRDMLGFGQIYTKKSFTNPQGYTSKPMVQYMVWNKSDVKVLADLLHQFPLRSKKRKDFELWAEAADLWYSTNFVGWKTKNGGINTEKFAIIERLRELAIQIVKVRSYTNQR